jgi:ribosomal protein S18 acetylase RimI-like enzyme
MSLLIRRATPADEDVVVAFNAALAWESEHKKLDEAVLRAGVRAALADPAKGFYVLVTRDGEPVGQTGVTFEWSDWRNGWYWWIQSVYVREDARRQGVFTALYRHIEGLALADPAVIGIRLYVERENVPAQETYRKLGLTEEGYFLMARYPLPGRGNRVVRGRDRDRGIGRRLRPAGGGGPVATGAALAVAGVSRLRRGERPAPGGDVPVGVPARGDRTGCEPRHGDDVQRRLPAELPGGVAGGGRRERPPRRPPGRSPSSGQIMTTPGSGCQGARAPGTPRWHPDPKNWHPDHPILAT